jgi:hypothetical protein
MREAAPYQALVGPQGKAQEGASQAGIRLEEASLAAAALRKGVRQVEAWEGPFPVQGVCQGHLGVVPQLLAPTSAPTNDHNPTDIFKAYFGVVHSAAPV